MKKGQKKFMYELIQFQYFWKNYLLIAIDRFFQLLILVQ